MLNGKVAGNLAFGLSATHQQHLVQELKQMEFQVILFVIGVLGVLSYFLGSFLTRPLNALIKGADDIAEKGPGQILAIHGGDEIARVASAFNHMSESLAVSYSELHQTVERYKQLSTKLTERDAIKSAMLATSLDAIITIDGDATYPIENCKEAIDYLLDQDLDFVSCSRFPLRNRAARQSPCAAPC